jgi:hypothetical protein
MTRLLRWWYLFSGCCPKHPYPPDSVEAREYGYCAVCRMTRRVPL